MEAIITATELDTLTVDDALAGETGTKQEQLIERAQSAIGGYVDLEQFGDVYPSEVKLATVYTVEALYKKGGVMSGDEMVSEKIGDYSYTREGEEVANIIPKTARMILDKYRNLVGSFNLSISGYDRKYTK